MKIIAISKELYKEKERIPKKILQQKHFVLKTNPNKQLKKYYNNNEIHIFDLYKNPKKKKPKIYYINNHINKTGENTLIINKQEKTAFYDITSIYKQSEKGLIAECYGKKTPSINKQKTYIPTYFLCHYAITAHLYKIKNIYGYVVL